MRPSHRLLTVVVLLTVIVTAGAVPTSGQTATHTVQVDLPSQFVVGENEVRVAVTDTGNGNNLFSPIVEVPLETGLAAPDPDPYVEYDGTTENRTKSVQASSYTSGDALYVYGQNIPDGETRTYVFTLEVKTAGSHTVEADVRPLYNESNNERGSTTATALGVGILGTTVMDGDANATIPGATSTVGTTQKPGGQSEFDLLNGTYDVTASGGGTDFPTLSLTIDAFETRNATFTHYDDLTDPRVIARVSESEVVNGSSQVTITAFGSATSPRRVETSFRLDAEAGATVVGVDDPAEIDPASARTPSVTDGTLTDTTTTDGRTRLTIENEGVASVTVEYVGYDLGDADLDGGVDAADAQTAAQAAASGSRAPSYADVDGDGNVTAVDAMLIAQYDENNRDADYGRP